jgi:hypothetical protein
MLAADCAADGESFVNVNMIFVLFKGFGPARIADVFFGKVVPCIETPRSRVFGVFEFF